MHDTIKIIAHRGASGIIGQDNTLASFQLAIDLGCDMVELDVRQTRDGQLVCFHDPAVDETKVTDLSFDELRTRSGVDVPTFEQAVQLCAGKIAINVEIKEPGYEQPSIQILQAHMRPDEFDVECFNVNVVSELGRIAPTITRGLLASAQPSLTEAETLNTIAAAAADCKADFLSLEHSLIGDPLFAHPVLSKLPVYCWTVDDPVHMRKIFQCPIAAIVTNRPDHAIKALR